MQRSLRPHYLIHVRYIYSNFFITVPAEIEKTISEFWFVYKMRVIYLAHVRIPLMLSKWLRLVIALVIKHRSTLALLISNNFASYHTQDSHLDNISRIRTRAIVIILNLKNHLCWKKDIHKNLKFWLNYLKFRLWMLFQS